MLGELGLVLIVEQEAGDVDPRRAHLQFAPLPYNVLYDAVNTRRNEVASMQQEFLLLADGAEAVNGKIYILGGGVDRHFVQAGAERPIQLRADIAVGILVDWGETNNRYPMSVKVIDEDEHEILSIDGEFEAGRPPGAKPGQSLRTVLSIRGPFPIPSPGAYRVQLQLEGKPQAPAFRFWIDELTSKRP